MIASVTKLLLYLEGYPHPDSISPWKMLLPPNGSYIEPNYFQ